MFKIIVIIFVLNILTKLINESYINKKFSLYHSLKSTNTKYYSKIVTPYEKGNKNTLEFIVLFLTRTISLITI